MTRPGQKLTYTLSAYYDHMQNFYHELMGTPGLTTAQRIVRIADEADKFNTVDIPEPE